MLSTALRLGSISETGVVEDILCLAMSFPMALDRGSYAQVKRGGRKEMDNVLNEWTRLRRDSDAGSVPGTERFHVVPPGHSGVYVEGATNSHRSSRLPTSSSDTKLHAFSSSDLL